MLNQVQDNYNENQISDEVIVYYKTDFFGGMNDVAYRTQLKKNQFVNLENCNISQAGIINKLNGFTVNGTQTDLSTAIMDLAWYDYNNNQMELCITGTHLQKKTSVSGTWTDITTGLDNTEIYRMVAGHDKMYILSSKANDARSWDGTTLTTETNIPQGHIGCYNQNRLFVVKENDDDIYYSDTLELTVFDTTNHVVTIATTGFDMITALIPLTEESILVCKKHSIWLLELAAAPLTGNPHDLWRVSLITDKVGVIGDRAITKIPSDVIFANDDGIYSLNAIRQNIPLGAAKYSANIQTLWDNLSIQWLNLIAITYNDDTVYISVPYNASTYNNMLIYFNYKNLQLYKEIGWAKSNDYSIACWTETYWSNTKQLIGGEASDHSYTYNVFKSDIYNSNSLNAETPMTFTIETENILFDTSQLHIKKIGDYLQVITLPSIEKNLQVYASLDDGDYIRIYKYNNEDLIPTTKTTAVLPVNLPFTLDEELQEKVHRFALWHLGEFRTIRFKFVNTSLYAYFRIISFAVKAYKASNEIEGLWED